MINVRNEMVLDALTGRMTAKQVSERLGESTRETVPVLNRLLDEGQICRTVDAKTVARFAPLATAAVHQLPDPRPLAVMA